MEEDKVVAKEKPPAEAIKEPTQEVATKSTEALKEVKVKCH